MERNGDTAKTLNERKSMNHKFNKPESLVFQLTHPLVIFAAGALACAAATLTTCAPPVKSADPNPALDYSEPDVLLRDGGKSPIEYSSREVNCSIGVYPFRVCQG